MAKRTMNAKEFLADIKTGMDDAHLMEKYRLSRGSPSECVREARGYGPVEAA